MQYVMSTNNLGHETCQIVFIKMTAKSKFLLARPCQSMARMVKIPFIIFHLARLIFTGKSNYKLCEYETQASSLLSVLAWRKCTILDKFHRLIELYFELS